MVDLSTVTSMFSKSPSETAQLLSVSLRRMSRRIAVGFTPRISKNLSKCSIL